MKSETVFVQQHPKHGYEIRTEMVENPEEGCDPIKMLSAYTDAGNYIGNQQTAKFLCEEKEIKPELKTQDSNICSIGFCEKEQQWYGWSCYGLSGFGIGSSVKKGDCAFVPSKEDIEKECEQNESEFETLRDGSIMISTKPDRDNFSVMPGHGEWTAKTLDDAKRMAIDFADSVA